MKGSFFSGAVVYNINSANGKGQFIGTWNKCNYIMLTLENSGEVIILAIIVGSIGHLGIV